MVTEDSLVIVGRIGAAYGVRGWVHLQSFTDPVENLVTYEPWHLQQNGRWRALGGLQGNDQLQIRKHKGGFVAQLDGCDDRDAAQGYRGAWIGVPASALPELAVGTDEYYWRDLIGLQVYDTQGAHLGTVTGLMETGAHEVLQIEVPFRSNEAQQEGGTHQTSDAGADKRKKAETFLVPFVAQYVLSVDVRERTVTVDWDLEW